MKKIEIARELVNAINENNKLSGNHIYTKEEIQQLVAKTADRNSKENLETLLDEECERNARLVKAQERERKTYNFEHSEEGLKAADELHSAIKNWTNDIKDEIHTIAEEVLGSKWEAYNITSTGFEVGLLGEDGNPVWVTASPYASDMTCATQRMVGRSISSFKPTFARWVSSRLTATQNRSSTSVSASSLQARRLTAS